MIVTEQEARGKWCPAVRLLNLSLTDDARDHMKEDPNDVPIVSESATHNRIYVGSDPTDLDPEQGTYCIAAKCMFWRWVNQTKNTDGNWNVWPDHDFDPNGQGFTSPERVGYCGKAGVVNVKNP